MSRRSTKRYFPEVTGAPSSLKVITQRRVRFEEVDPLGIVWHGRYASYLEDGRAEFGDHLRLSYLNMYEQGFLAPIVQMHLDYHTPLFFPEDFAIETVLHWTDAVRLNFAYKLIGPENKTIATAYTVQLFTTLEGEIQLVAPAYIEEFREKWRRGDVK